MARLNQRDFRRKKSEHTLHTEIWLEKRGAKPTDEEIRDAYDYVKENQRVPKGWKLAAINWNHSKSGTHGWRTGSISDLFSSMELALDALEDNFRIGIVRQKKGALGVWEIHIAMEY